MSDKIKQIQCKEKATSGGIPKRFAHIDEKKLMRKLDFHLLPLFVILYLLSFLDRGNIGNAKILGLADDLHLSENQYNMCLTVFFIFYSVMEVPSNMVLKRTRPKLYLPLTVVTFAIATTCMGVVENYHQLLATRALRGIFEAGVFPGISYILSRYYRSNELLVRQAIFFSAASMAGAFSGLLAAAISKMDGVGGYEGWRWIFILEGIVTFIAGAVAFLIFPEYPSNASFLSLEEREFVIHRVQFSSGTWTEDPANEEQAEMNGLAPKKDLALEEELALKEEQGPEIRQVSRSSLKGTVEDNSNDMSHLWAVFKDWQCYCQTLTYMGVLVPLYSTSLFTPSIIRTLGYSATRAQLMTVPIYILAAICAVAQGFASDHFGVRAPFLVLNFTCMAIGYIVCLTGDPVSNGKGIYAGIYIAAIGMYPAVPMSIVWNANNLSGTYKRAIGIAFQIGVANFSGAFVSYFYRARDAPDYRFGHGLVLMFIGIGAIFTAILISGYWYENRSKKAAVARGVYLDVPGEELAKMGDKSPFFVYRY